MDEQVKQTSTESLGDKNTAELFLFLVEFCNVLLGAQDAGELHSDDNQRNLPKHENIMSCDPENHLFGCNILIHTSLVLK